ncbi:MAG TPA: FHA domain-containing protein [Coleofasciculaceae cyanobacterium]|jgi:pSer/pThr/pTyr-binding forkhead associated (FHA) protein
MKGAIIPRLIHVQTTTLIELPPKTVIRIGKPGSNWFPDIDVSDLPNSDVVSRSHLEIRVQGNDYFVEDLGSSNGTYLNSSCLTPFTPCKLRVGDRIDLGKDEVFTLIFREAKQVSVSSASTRSGSTFRENKRLAPVSKAISSIPITTNNSGIRKNDQEQNQRQANLFSNLISVFNSLISKLIKKLIGSALKVGFFLIAVFVGVPLVLLLLKSLVVGFHLPVELNGNKPAIEISVESQPNFSDNNRPSRQEQPNNPGSELVDRNRKEPTPATEAPTNTDSSSEKNTDTNNTTETDRFEDLRFRVIEAKSLKNKFVRDLFKQACEPHSVSTSANIDHQSLCTKSGSI